MIITIALGVALGIIIAPVLLPVLGVIAGVVIIVVIIRGVTRFVAAVVRTAATVVRAAAAVPAAVVAAIREGRDPHRTDWIGIGSIAVFFGLITWMIAMAMLQAERPPQAGETRVTSTGIQLVCTPEGCGPAAMNLP
jgi:hypothetical protein